MRGPRLAHLALAAALISPVAPTMSHAADRPTVSCSISSTADYIAEWWTNAQAGLNNRKDLPDNLRQVMLAFYKSDDFRQKLKAHLESLGPSQLVGYGEEEIDQVFCDYRNASVDEFTLGLLIEHVKQQDLAIAKAALIVMRIKHRGMRRALGLFQTNDNVLVEGG